MALEIFIVGDEQRRSDLAEQVSSFGYNATECGPEAMIQRLEDGWAPAAIVLCAVGADTAGLMAQLRRSRRGAAVPVMLCGELGGDIRDLSDVLDLGADHFLEEPVRDTPLREALEVLAGPPDAGVTWDAGSGSGGPSTGSTSEMLWPAPARPPGPPPGRTVESPQPDARTEDGGSGDAAEVDANPEPDPEPTGSESSNATAQAPNDAFEPEGEDAKDAGDSEPVAAEPPRARRVTEVTDLPSAGASASAPIEAPAPIQASETLPPADGDPSVDRPRRILPLSVHSHGSLEQIEVPRLLWRFHQTRTSGTVSLGTSSVQKAIRFEDGRIVAAHSNDPADQFTAALLRRGLLSRSHYEAAVASVGEEELRHPRGLVTSGLLKVSELPRLVRGHVRRVVQSTFPWSVGTWVLEPSPAEAVPLQLEASVARILTEGIREYMHPRQLWDLLGAGATRIRWAGGVDLGRLDALASDLDLSDAGRAGLPVLSASEGPRTLTELVSDPAVTHTGEFVALVYALAVLGLVELVGDEVTASSKAGSAAEIDRGRIASRLRLAREADYFSLLGLSPTGSALEVRRAYAELAPTFADAAIDPDVREGMRGELEEVRRALADAHTVLNDDALRLAYAAHLEEA